MGTKFDYKDPDNRPIPNASVATIEIGLTAANLCSCKTPGTITIDIEFDVHGNGNPWQNFNKISQQAGEFIIDGTVVKFKGAPNAAPNSQKDSATHTITLPACPKGGQQGKGVIKVVDLTRKGTLGWTGVSQIYEYKWSYSCDREDDENGKCVSCRVNTKFASLIRQTASNTVQPNL